jgi:hypothetical protein
VCVRGACVLTVLWVKMYLAAACEENLLMAEEFPTVVTGLPSAPLTYTYYYFRTSSFIGFRRKYIST